MSPLVSICMNTYRHEAYIRQAIEGVMMQQTGFPYQLVIGEDYSNDDTRRICEELKLKYADRIRLLPSDKNHGQCENLYRTIMACNGKYIALCEGDDLWIDPYKLQKQVDFLESHPDHVLCFHPVHTIDQYSRMVEEGEPGQIQTFYKGGEFFHTFMPTLSIVFRNCLRSFPEEFFAVKSTDAFIVGMLSGFGDGAKLGFVGGCYRRHDGGLYNQLQELDKYKQSIHTRKLMKRSSYFKRSQKQAISRELKRREMLYIKIFLKRRQLLNCVRIILFYVSIW